MIGGCWNPSKYSGEKTPFSQHMYIVRTNYLCTLNRAFGMHNAKRTIVFLNFKNMWYYQLTACDVVKDITENMLKH
jgi:hypothetical protein